MKRSGDLMAWPARWCSRLRSGLVAFLLLVILAVAAPAGAAGPQFSAEQLEADLRFMIRTVGEVHPAMADVRKQDAFEARAEQILQELEPTMSLQAFSLLAARVLQALPVADAHTRLTLPPDELTLPIRLDWVSDGLVVLQAQASAPLRRGDHIIRLGGLTHEELLEGLRAFIPAENDAWIRSRGKELLHYRYILEALGAVDADGTVRVTFWRHDEASPGAEPREVQVVLGFGPSHPEALVPAADPERPWFGWRIEPEHSLGLFWLDSCQDTPEYREAVDAFFTAVKSAGVRKVAIDVRRNTGGNSAVIEAILKYVPAKTVRMYSGKARFSPQANEQRGYSFVFRLGFTLFGALPRTASTPRPADPDLLFDGELYVLTSGHTFSSGLWIPVILGDNGLATVVGEPTGGAPSGYGDILTFQLPETGLRFSVSHKRWIRPDRSRDPAYTLMPDQLIPTTVEDIRLQRDPQIDWVRSVPPRVNSSSGRRALRRRPAPLRPSLELVVHGDDVFTDLVRVCLHRHVLRVRAVAFERFPVHKANNEPDGVPLVPVREALPRRKAHHAFDLAFEATEPSQQLIFLSRSTFGLHLEQHDVLNHATRPPVPAPRRDMRRLRLEGETPRWAGPF